MKEVEDKDEELSIPSSAMDEILLYGWAQKDDMTTHGTIHTRVKAPMDHEEHCHHCRSLLMTRAQSSII